MVDGGVVLAGWTDGTAAFGEVGAKDFFAVKLDLEGDLIWTWKVRFCGSGATRRMPDKNATAWNASLDKIRRVFARMATEKHPFFLVLAESERGHGSPCRHFGKFLRARDWTA